MPPRPLRNIPGNEAPRSWPLCFNKFFSENGVLQCPRRRQTKQGRTDWVVGARAEHPAHKRALHNRDFSPTRFRPTSLPPFDGLSMDKSALFADGQLFAFFHPVETIHITCECCTGADMTKTMLLQRLSKCWVINRTRMKFSYDGFRSREPF